MIGSGRPRPRWASSIGSGHHSHLCGPQIGGSTTTLSLHPRHSNLRRQVRPPSSRWPGPPHRIFPIPSTFLTSMATLGVHPGWAFDGSVARRCIRACNRRQRASRCRIWASNCSPSLSSLPAQGPASRSRHAPPSLFYASRSTVGSPSHALCLPPLPNLPTRFPTCSTLWQSRAVRPVHPIVCLVGAGHPPPSPWMTLSYVVHRSLHCSPPPGRRHRPAIALVSRVGYPRLGAALANLGPRLWPKQAALLPCCPVPQTSTASTRGMRFAHCCAVDAFVQFTQLVTC